MLFLIAFSAASALISFTVRSLDPAMGRQTAIAAAVAAMLSIVGKVSGVFDEIAALAELGGIGIETVKYVLKAVGIAYFARVAASICSDAGESALAEAAELSGRLALVMMTLPIVRRIVEYIIELLNGTM